MSARNDEQFIDVKCFVNAAKKLVPDVQKVIQDLKTKDFTSALTDAKQLVADAETEFAPCVNSSINIAKCLVAAAKDLVPDVQKIV